MASGISLSHAATNELTISSISVSGSNVIVKWQGGVGPYQLLCKTNYQDDWRKLGPTTSGYSATNPITSAAYCVFLVTTDLIAPSTPGSVQVTTNSCNQLFVKWNGSTDNANGAGVKGYNIYRNGKKVVQVLAPATNLADVALNSLTTYSYAISAIDVVGNESPQSPYVSATTPNCTNHLPIASVGPSQTNSAGVAIAFSAAGSHDLDGTINSFSWSFGDGATANGSNVVHVFSSAGNYNVRLTVTDNLGGVASSSAVVVITNVVNQVPIANAGPNQTNLVGASLVFNAAGSVDPDGSIASYIWNFGDNTSASGSVVSHAYLTAGTYSATLGVTDNAGATSSSSAVVVITNVPNRVPIANAGPNQTNLVGASVLFNAAASSDADGSIVAYIWDFGDNTTGSGSSIIHNYSGSGVYSVTLTVTDNGGAIASSSAVVVITNAPPVNQLPVAVAGSPQTNMVGVQVNFTAAGSMDPDGTISSYSWNFGDGWSGVGATQGHSYSTKGYYTVTLTVTDNAGSTTSASIPVTITNPPAGNQLPIGSAGPDQTNGIGAAVNFSAQGSYDPDGTIASYTWNFGDYGTGAGINASHVYTNAGTYTVTLILRDNLGAVGGDTVLIVITNGVAIQNRLPVAKAGSNQTNKVGTSLGFNAAGSYDPDGTVRSFVWNFGDGISQAGSNVTHAYNTAGNFTVGLSVTDNSGASATANILVVITNIPNRPPVASAGPNQTNRIGASLNFNAAGSYDPDGTISSFAWNFGDGVTGSGSNITHVYTNPGTYTVGLVVTDNLGAMASVTSLVLITNIPNRLPIANAGGNQTNKVGATLSFSGANSTDADGAIVSYAWSFGDGTSASGSSVTHAYNTAGTYSVGLTVTDNVGGTGSASVLAIITNVPNQAPIAVAEANQTNIVGATLSFSAAASYDSDGTIVSYAWNFGDGSSAAGATTTHSYAATGNYSVALTVTDNSGASSSSSVKVAITNAAPSNFPPISDPGPNQTVEVNTPVSLSGAGSRDPDGTNLVYSWSFGDGSSASGMNVTHTYANTGVFTATLTVTDRYNSVGSSNVTIRVNGPATPGQFISVKTMGGTGAEQSEATAVDASGNILVAGSSGGHPFLGKRSADGTLLWNFYCGGPGSGLFQGVAVDRYGNVYVTGYFYATEDFGGGPLTSAGGYDIVMAKYSRDGVHIWSKKFGGGKNSGLVDEGGFGIAVDSLSDTILVTGIYDASVDFGNGTVLTTTSGQDVFLARFSFDGGVIWSKRIGGTGMPTATGVALDQVGNIFLTGSFNASVDFGKGAVNSYGIDCYVAKFTSSGANLWMDHFGSSTTPTRAYGYGLTVDHAGNVIFTGSFTYTINLGGTNMISKGFEDVFLAKYSGADGSHMWSKSFGTAAPDAGCGVASDSNNNIVFTGKITPAADFGKGLQSAGAGQNAFAASFGPDGTPRWSRVFGVGHEEGIAATYNSNGHCFIAGRFTSTVDFSSGSSSSGSVTAASSNYDIYLLELAP